MCIEANMNHNILLYVLDDPVEDALYMVFELVTQGEVLNVPTSSPLTEERAWFIFRQVILGTHYSHVLCLLNIILIVPLIYRN